MQIAIVGAGAIGCLFGLSLQRSGQSVLLVHHSKRIVASMKKNGVTLRTLTGKTVRVRMEVASALSNRDAPDLILLTVKSYDTWKVASGLRNTRNDPPVLSLQNGFGNIEALSRFIPKERILAGSTTESALLTGPGVLTHTGKGETWIGELHGKKTHRVNLFKRAFQNAGFSTHSSSRIEGVVWSKAVVNCVINPITAVAHVANGELLRNSNLRAVGLKMLTEAMEVAKASGVALSPEPSGLLFHVLKKTERNKSSMLRDLELRRMTEIRQLNGWIVKRGRLTGVRTPYNSLVTELVLGLEKVQRRL